MKLPRINMSRRSRIFLAVAVVVLWILVHQQISQMDGRFFRASLSGTKGLALYLVGNYSGAADAYRSHFQELYRVERTAADPAWDALLRGDLQSASAISRKVLEKDPSAIDALLTLGQVALEKEAPDEALEMFKRILQTAPDQFDALLLSSVAHTRSGAYGDAIDALKLAFRTGRIESRITSFLSALKTTDQLARLPRGARPVCLLAHLYRYLRIFDSSNAHLAVKYANQAIISGDRPDDGYVTLGVVSYMNGRNDQALRDFLKAIEANPTNAEAYRWAHIVYSDRGDIPNEYRMIKAAFESAPRDIFYFRAMTHVVIEQMGDYHQGMALTKKALEANPNDPFTLEAAGYIEHFLGDDERALVYYRRAVSLAPQNPSLHERIAVSLADLGRQEEAIAALRTSLAINPYSLQARLDLGLLYGRQHRHKEAIKEYEEAFRFTKPEVKYLVGLCTLYHLVSDFERAVECYKKVLIEDPRNTEANRNLAMTIKNLQLQKSKQ